MASAQSGALRSMPGYVARPSSTAVTPVVPSLAGLPTVPTLARDAAAPNYIGRNLLANQLASLTGQQAGDLTTIRAGAKQALAGYGGYGFQVDDPTTPQNEGLNLNYDSSKGMGQREIQAAAGARNNANAAGMLESSFANQNIASAVQRTSLEAQQVANQYAQAVNQTLTSYANQAAQIAFQWAGLYGQDALWQVDNPPPPPPPQPSSWDLHPGNPEGVAYENPATTPSAPAVRHMSYADFLKGRKSTSALAHKWDATYNYGRRFGGA